MFMGLFEACKSWRERRREHKLLEIEAFRILRDSYVIQHEMAGLLRKQTSLLVLIENDLREQRPRLTSVRLVFGTTFCKPTKLAAAEWGKLSPNLKRLIGVLSTPLQPGALPMPTPGPLSLLVGQSSTATLLYLDQNGNPMPATFIPPPVVFTVDTPNVVASVPSSDSQSDLLTGLLAGTATISATVVTAEGATLLDSAGITVSATPPPPAALASIKLVFSTPQ